MEEQGTLEDSGDTGNVKSTQVESSMVCGDMHLAGLGGVAAWDSRRVHKDMGQEDGVLQAALGVGTSRHGSQE